jgi:hypothetical protein
MLLDSHISTNKRHLMFKTACNALVLKDMAINKYERLSIITFRHKLKKRNGAFIVALHFIVTV